MPILREDQQSNTTSATTASSSVNVEQIANESADHVSIIMDSQDIVRVLLIGGTGVGKSSLCNELFREKIFETGYGRPVTQHFQAWKAKNFPIELHDSKGIEYGEESNQYIGAIAEYAEACKEQDTPLHMVWILIDGEQGRVTEFYGKLSTALRPILPVQCILITKCDKISTTQLDVMKKNINKLKPLVDVPVFATSNVKNRKEIGLDFDTCQNPACRDPDISYNKKKGQVICNTCSTNWNVDLSPLRENDKLLNFCVTNLRTEKLRSAFLKSISLSIPERVAISAGLIITTSAGAAAVGATPIPVSDWPILIAGQTAMLSLLAVTWSVPKKFVQSFIIDITLAAGAVAVTAVIGKVTAAILKTIPGLNFSAYVIDGCISSGFTAAIGITATIVFAAVYKKFNGSSEVSEQEFRKITSERTSATSFSGIVGRLSRGVAVEQILEEHVQAQA